MWRGLSCRGCQLLDDGEMKGSGRGTCLPIMPMQAIDGVVMVATGD